MLSFHALSITFHCFLCLCNGDYTWTRQLSITCHAMLKCAQPIPAKPCTIVVDCSLCGIDANKNECEILGSLHFYKGNKRLDFAGGLYDIIANISGVYAISSFMTCHNHLAFFLRLLLFSLMLMIWAHIFQKMLFVWWGTFQKCIWLHNDMCISPYDMSALS